MKNTTVKIYLTTTVALALSGCQQQAVLPQIVHSMKDISYVCSEQGKASAHAFEDCKLDGMVTFLPASNSKYEEYVEEARARILPYAEKRDKRKLSKKGWEKKRNEIYEIMLSKISVLDSEAQAKNKRMQRFGAALASGMRQQADFHQQQANRLSKTHIPPTNRHISLLRHPLLSIAQ